MLVCLSQQAEAMPRPAPSSFGNLLHPHAINGVYEEWYWVLMPMRPNDCIDWDN